MSDLRQDGNLEADDAPNFSLFNSRIESFNGSSIAQEIPAERLAQAGFYFTGHGDRVCCFSCKKTIENWHRGDTPVDRHKEVSPTCSFITCTYPMDLLRSGAVVDESTYPLSPQMRNEEVRFQTFSSWPSSAPVRPQELAQAGFYYMGNNDQVQCFCCDGVLGSWEPEDTAWEEHSRHFPNCFFILGHDVGNIPFSREGEECRNRQNRRTHTFMSSYEERLGSFAGLQHPVEHERLAEAGFYSTGKGDTVQCFRCGGGLRGWQPDEDPWTFHAIHYPGCRFLLAEKGQEFVNSIQLQAPRGRDGSSQNEDSTNDEDLLEKLKKLQQEKLCKICMDRDISIVLIPCGHLVSCGNCSKLLIKCPICCGSISQKVKTYIS